MHISYLCYCIFIRNIFPYSCIGKAFKLSSDGDTVDVEEIHNLHSTQEETDTRVVLYCLYAREKGYKHVVVRSPDSDIPFILLYYAAKLASSSYNTVRHWARR